MKKRRHGHKNRPSNFKQEIRILRRIVTFLKTYCLPEPKDYKKFITEIMAVKQIMPFKERREFVQKWIQENAKKDI